MVSHLRLITVSLAGLLALSLSPATVSQAAPPVVSPYSAPDGVLGSFSALGAGTSGSVTAVVVADDTVYVGGFFGSASGVTVNRIAAWSNGTWSALGTGMDNTVDALAVCAGWSTDGCCGSCRGCFGVRALGCTDIYGFVPHH